jgi:Ca2+-binding EF-hand superfamily protein
MAPSKYEQFFRDADKDNSGSLTVAELTELLRKLGFKDADSRIQSMFRSVDTSGDNKISLEEFLIAMGEVAPKDQKQATMRQCFREFDMNGDGTIDRSELTAVFKSLGTQMTPDEIDRIMKMADKDASGSMNYEEFIQQVFP